MNRVGGGGLCILSSLLPVTVCLPLLLCASGPWASLARAHPGTWPKSWSHTQKPDESVLSSAQRLSAPWGSPWGRTTHKQRHFSSFLSKPPSFWFSPLPVTFTQTSKMVLPRSGGGAVLASLPWAEAGRPLQSQAGRGSPPTTNLHSY